MEMNKNRFSRSNLAVVLALLFVGGYALGQMQALNVLPWAQAQRESGSEIDLPDLTPLVRQSRDSVVFMVISGGEDPEDDGLPEDHPRVPPDSQKGVGSGFIIDRDGFILTNDHVIADAEKVEVVVSGGQRYTAEVVGRDPQLDVALVKIEAEEELQPIKLGNSGRTRVGQWVVAMGNPFGLENNVTVGVISGKGRELAEAPFVEFLQTDAAIYPGNSGGPLLDLEGRAIGINTAAVPGTQLGFSIPIDRVKEVLPQLREGRVVRGFIGVEMGQGERIPKSAARNSGVLIMAATQGGPADKAGIRANDVIVEYGGKKVNSPTELAQLVDRSKPGRKVPVKVRRDGRERTLTLRVDEAPVPKN
jgi:serine protease Do